MVSEEGLNAYGAVTWGQFFVYQGFNEKTGWMHTSTYTDVIDEFKETILNFEGFYVLGYIDSLTEDFNRLIDYKTGGKNKELEYIKPEYTQLHLYALSLRQETGITPQKASVEFIRREGNAFRGQKLTVGSEVIEVEIDISYNRLKDVYWETLKTAKEIEQFYKLNK